MIKIVQTFWNVQKGDILLNAGSYACPEIYWMSWAFSCLQLRKFYPDVEMYTDNAGKELFELLGLPYTKIHTTLENDKFMKNCLPELWAYAKIHTYSIQDKPFYSKHEFRKRQIEKEKQLSDILLDNKQLHNDISFEIERIKEEIVQIEENIKAVEKRFYYSKKIYEIRKEQYRHGILSITDLLTSENSMKNAELEFVYERYKLQYNLQLIEFYWVKK